MSAGVQCSLTADEPPFSMHPVRLPSVMHLNEAQWNGKEETVVQPLYLTFFKSRQKRLTSESRSVLKTPGRKKNVIFVSDFAPSFFLLSHSKAIERCFMNKQCSLKQCHWSRAHPQDKRLHILSFDSAYFSPVIKDIFIRGEGVQPVIDIFPRGESVH